LVTSLFNEVSGTLPQMIVETWNHAAQWLEPFLQKLNSLCDHLWELLHLIRSDVKLSVYWTNGSSPSTDVMSI